MTELPLPLCARCCRPVETVKIDQVGGQNIILTARCHGGSESVSIAVPADIRPGLAFATHAQRELAAAAMNLRRGRIDRELEYRILRQVVAKVPR